MHSIIGVYALTYGHYCRLLHTHLQSLSSTFCTNLDSIYFSNIQLILFSYHYYALDSLSHTYLYNPMVHRPWVDLQKSDLTYIKEDKNHFDSLLNYAFQDHNLWKLSIFLHKTWAFAPKLTHRDPSQQLN